MRKPLKYTTERIAQNINNHGVPATVRDFDPEEIIDPDVSGVVRILGRLYDDAEFFRTELIDILYRKGARDG